LGFDIVISHLKENDLNYVQQAVKTYNNIKPIIWQGDQYRLANPTEGSLASMQYVNATKTSAVMFNFLVNNRYDQGSKFPVRLKGLDSAKHYRIKELNVYPGTSSTIDPSKTYTGEFLMTIGFNPHVNTGRASVILEIESIP
jgi:alpha-galactosidase